MTVIDSAVSGALEVLRRCHGRPVTYQRGTATALAVTGVMGRSLLERTDESGAVVQGQVSDWLLKAADLVLDGARIVPQSGDTIGYDGRAFEVMPVGPEGEFRQIDNAGEWLRVHTKEVPVKVVEVEPEPDDE